MYLGKTKLKYILIYVADLPLSQNVEGNQSQFLNDSFIGVGGKKNSANNIERLPYARSSL